MLLKDYLEAIQYKISGGSEYSWECFGPNARYLDCVENELSDGRYSINAVFDGATQDIYAIELWDYERNREYRWIDPDYRTEHDAECHRREIDPNESLDGNRYIDLEVTEDILEKIAAVVAGEDYDERVKVPVDFTDEELLKYMKLAHDQDITFNQLVERALKNAIDELRINPDAFKAKAESFKREKGLL
jgi:hypothetical protein